jgi:hypothetical protein
MSSPTLSYSGSSSFSGSSASSTGPDFFEKSTSVSELSHSPVLSMDFIREAFARNFNAEFPKVKASPSEDRTTDLALLRNCEKGYAQVREIKDGKKITYFFAFCLNLTPADAKKHRKTHDSEIGFFNFNIHRFPEQKEGEFLLSYFNEIKIDDKFQSLGLSSVFINAYSKTLKDIGVHTDYLHVKSRTPFTATIYEGKGYQFTPETAVLLEQSYQGREAYLSDCSVSFDDTTTIEMYRVINPSQFDVTSSIASLEQKLGS